MVELRGYVARVSARTWFALAVLLTVAGYACGADALWSLAWLIPHAVLLCGVWRGSRVAWAILLSVSVALAGALALVGVGMLFGSGFFMDINGWGPAAHGAALLCLVAFRAVGRRSAASPDAAPDPLGGAGHGGTQSRRARWPVTVRAVAGLFGVAGGGRSRSGSRPSLAQRVSGRSCSSVTGKGSE